MHWALSVELFRYKRTVGINDKTLDIQALGVLNAVMRNKQNQYTLVHNVILNLRLARDSYI